MQSVGYKKHMIDENTAKHYQQITKNKNIQRDSRAVSQKLSHTTYPLVRPLQHPTGYCNKTAVAHNSMSYHWNWTPWGSKEAHGCGEYFLKSLRAQGHVLKGVS